jgi:hypothetical protein
LVAAVPACRPLLHALLLQGVAHGYGVELDRVKVAKAEAFCRGVLEELSQRGMFTDGSSSSEVAAASTNGAAAVKQKQLQGTASHTDVAGSAAEDQCKQQQVQEKVQEQTQEESVGSQPCSEPLSQAELSMDASSQASTAAAADSTAAGAGSSKAPCKGSKSKLLLQQPQSSPIITCASIEQVHADS